VTSQSWRSRVTKLALALTVMQKEKGHISCARKLFGLLFIAVCLANDEQTTAPKTLGILAPIHYGKRGPVVPSFQGLTAAMLLAVHHVNTRDARLVGERTVGMLHPALSLRYRFADTFFGSEPAVTALMAWQYGRMDCSSPSNATAVHALPASALHEADPATLGVDAIIGAFSSEVSSTISALGSVRRVPTTSYASQATKLSNKNFHPDFSRTTPSVDFAALGICEVLQCSGWKRIAVIYSATEYGRSFSLSVDMYARQHQHLNILANFEFKVGDVDSIRFAVMMAKQSGANVFVLCDAAPSSSIVHVLFVARELGISCGDGYLWMSYEQNNPDVLAAAFSSQYPDIPNSEVQRMLVGWLNVGLFTSPSQLAALSEAFSLLSEQERITLNHRALLYEDLQTFGNITTTYSLFAYDSVWATALGLSALNLEGGASKGTYLSDYIRRSNFTGSSGNVSFDAHGDRAHDTLSVIVHNYVASRSGGGEILLIEQPLLMWKMTTGCRREPETVPQWPGGKQGWNSKPGDGTPWHIENQNVFVALLVVGGGVLMLILGGLHLLQHLRTRRHANNYWQIPSAELELAAQARVLGYGSFGPVREGLYRGTQVAIKRLAPGKADEASLGPEPSYTPDACIEGSVNENINNLVFLSSVRVGAFTCQKGNHRLRSLSASTAEVTLN